jgi:hypothetical protein
MKKTVCIALIVLFLLGISSVASAGKFSFGAFAGVNIPIAQSDAKSGVLFGAKGRVTLLPFLGLEPNFTSAKHGGKDIEVRETSFSRKGGNITSFGLDVIIGTLSSMSKMRIYGLLGINSNTYGGEGISDESGLGLALGTGLEFFATEFLSVETRAKYHPIKLGDGGRVHLELSGGLNYYFGGK